MLDIVVLKTVCKYGQDNNCPVVLGLEEQAYPCEECDNEKVVSERPKRKLDTRPMITKFREFESYIFESETTLQSIKLTTQNYKKYVGEATANIQNKIKQYFDKDYKCVVYIDTKHSASNPNYYFIFDGFGFSDTQQLTNDVIDKIKKMPCKISESYKLFESNDQYNNIIDYTFLKPNTTIDDVRRICNEAKEANFYSVCILPDFISYAKTFLDKTNVKICTVISFPKGVDKTIDKVNETNRAIADGADEIDMVMNYKLLMKGDEESFEKCQKDIMEVARVCHKDGIILKVIIESGVLTYDQIKKACDICVEAGADFVKTSTGFAKVGAEIEKVQFMRKILPDYMKIKASGGIRTIDDFKIYFPFVDRIGTSANPNVENKDNTY